MNGKTYPYLDLVALAPVGAALLDAGPAFVFSGEGSRILWANAAGVAFFGERRMGDLLDRQLSGLNPLKAQSARLARLLPSQTTRLEMLRIGQGVTFATLPAACRRLNLADGKSAVLAVAVAGETTESLLTRAERLVDTIAQDDCLAAVLDRDGKVLGASGGYDALAPAEAAIDALIEAAGSARTGIAKRPLTIGRVERPAGAARFVAGERECFLLIVGPAEAMVQSTPQPVAMVPAEAPRPEPQEAATEQQLPEPAEEAPPPRPAAEPIVRFAFALDRDHRFAFVSPELAEAVGDDNAAVLGKRWQTVADVLGLDADGTVGDRLATNRMWSARVRWPAAGGETVGVDLNAFPVPADDGHGFRGFGLVHLGDRHPDERPTRPSLAEVDDRPPREFVAPSEPVAPDSAVPEEPTATASPEGPERIAEPPAAPPSPPQSEEMPEDLRSTAGEDLDDAARKSIEEGATVRPPQAPVAGDRGAGQPPSNIVALPGAVMRPPRDRLSGTERDAFRRIAETLGLRQAGEQPPATEEAAAPVEPAAPKEAPRALAGELDARLLDRLPVGLVILRDNRTLFANRTLLDLAGYDSLAAFIAAGGADALFDGGPDGWAGGLTVSGGRLTARRRDGKTVPVEVRLNAVTWGQATALMLSIVPSRDEESVRQLTADLVAAEARSEELAAILDTATDGVIVVDRAGRIGSMNRASEALFGVDASEYLGRSFTDLLADESRRPALDYLDGLASNGVASVLNDGREVIGRVPQGGLIPLFMTMGRIGDGEKFCAVLRDITHWKNVEEELIAARRGAETASAQKSEFLAKISHEIRTPLNAIIGFSEVMMEERFGPIGNDRYRTYLSDIHVSGQHLMSLINDLLDLSKVEAGKLELSFEAVAVNSVIQECVALMQPQANRERIIIRTSLSADVPSVVADRRSLRQILLNLLSNAVKFTRAGGQVIVSSSLENSGEVVLRIRDTGIGMSEKDVEAALKPFRQLATAKNGGQRGTGLGLPLTKALVEANRASFAIDSAVNQGTLIRITFPTTRVLAG